MKKAALFMALVLALESIVPGSVLAAEQMRSLQWKLVNGPVPFACSHKNKFSMVI